MLTYPAWCKEMQTKLEADVDHVLFPEDEPPFFDWTTYVYCNFILLLVSFVLLDNGQQEV